MRKLELVHRKGPVRKLELERKQVLARKKGPARKLELVHRKGPVRKLVQERKQVPVSEHKAP